MSPVQKAVIAPPATRWHQYPASSAMPVALFPLVDRDGLTKPLIQIIAEEALDSGIMSIAVIATTDEERIFRDYFTRWQNESAKSLKGHDWAELQSDKLQTLGERMTFVHSTEPRSEDNAPDFDLYAARSFVGPDSFLLLPASTIFLSGTKDRCANQLLSRWIPDAQSLTMITPVLQRQTAFATIVQASMCQAEREVFEMKAIAHQPTMEQCCSLRSAELPFGHFYADTGMGIFGPQLFDALDACQKLWNSSTPPKGSLLSLAQQSLIDRNHQSYCVPLHGSVYDAALPYGLLQAQLGLALAGIHRTDICEMITTSLAEQAKS